MARLISQQWNNNVTTYLAGWSATPAGNPQVAVVVDETKILVQNQHIEPLLSANRIKLLWFRRPRALVSDSVNIPNPPHPPHSPPFHLLLFRHAAGVYCLCSSIDLALFYWPTFVTTYQPFLHGFNKVGLLYNLELYTLIAHFFSIIYFNL